MHDGHDHDVVTLPDATLYGPYLKDGPTPIANYAYKPTKWTVKDGNWFDPAVWSDGVPNDASTVEIRHAVKIEAVAVNGDLNGDGKVDANDYLAWDGHDIPAIRRFIESYLGIAKPMSGNAIADSCLVTPKGCLSIYKGSSLSVGTVQVLGCFELFGGDLIFRDLPFDYVKDAMQWGHGLIGHSGSKVMTRGGRVYSESDNGVRGHFALLHSCHPDIEGTEYFDLGRTQIGPLDNTQLAADGITAKHVGTNQMARYGGPHLHHCYGPPGLPADVPQFRIVNCKIHGGTKWGITVHQSHFGLVQGNEVWNCGGAGIAGEDGNEYGNTIDGNEVWDIFGDGLGQQGHNGGLSVQDVGDGTANNPYRTIGSHGNEGAAFWFRGACNHVTNNNAHDCPIGYSIWSRFTPALKRPVAKGDTPAKYIPLVAGSQLEHRFSGNTVVQCDLAAAIQGMVDTHVIDNLTVRNCPNGLDFSYNETIRLEDCNLNGTGSGWPMQPGFTNRFEWINCSVLAWRGAVQIWNDGLIHGGEYDTVNVQYKHVGSVQRLIIIDSAKIRRLSYTLGDLNKNVDYGAVSDLIVLNFNGVAGDNFQVFFPEQADDFIPKNLPDGNPRRVTPESGLTNKQLEDKHGWRFGGKGIPKGATTRDGVTGFVAPLPADLTPPRIIDRKVIATSTGFSVSFTTDKPTRLRTEWNTGDIKLGAFSKALPVAADFRTKHEYRVDGLRANTIYNRTDHVFDAIGNRGGDTRSAGINYIPHVVRTLK